MIGRVKQIRCRRLVIAWPLQGADAKTDRHNLPLIVHMRNGQITDAQSDALSNHSSSARITVRQYDGKFLAAITRSQITGTVKRGIDGTCDALQTFVTF